MQIYTIDDFQAMPWANGGGRTLQLFRLPHPQWPEAFALRFSIADVAQGGPFSFFPGVDRQLGLLEGEGMALNLADGRSLTLDQLGQVAAFEGELGVACRLLGGPLRDCNLMLARDWGQGDLKRMAWEMAETWTLFADDLVLLYLQQGQWQAEGRTLPGGCLLLLEREAIMLRVDGPAVAWLARVTRSSA
ncbi:HutD family protein [Chromobacterium phragmitis]|uniref:HutD/Ves family protein n=1 Tax=Chromobacterium amazonense TaxID=1382803 RepID=UPI0021B7B987|nr:HutD family protein [Chromobacterium amazonense]MBM2886285.1 HutD family protein [Chromobacterium amazonense]